MHPPLAELLVDRDSHLARLPAGEDRKGRPRVGDLAAERLRRLVGALGDRAAHPGARDVGEVGLGLAAVPAAEARAPEVDLARAAVQRHVDGGLDLSRDVVGADEVPACAARDHRDLDSLEAGDSVRDLVHRAVAADDDEELGAVPRGLRRERAELPRLLREERVPCEPVRCRLARHLWPAAACRSVRRRGIDQKNRAFGVCRWVSCGSTGHFRRSRGRARGS